GARRAIENPDSDGHVAVPDPRAGTTHAQSHFTADQIAPALPVELEQAGLAWTVLQETDESGILNFPAKFLFDDPASVRDIDVVHALPDFFARFISTPKLDKRLPEY